MPSPFVLSVCLFSVCPLCASFLRLSSLFVYFLRLSSLCVFSPFVLSLSVSFLLLSSLCVFSPCVLSLSSLFSSNNCVNLFTEVSECFLHQHLPASSRFR